MGDALTRRCAAGIGTDQISARKRRMHSYSVGQIGQLNERLNPGPSEDRPATSFEPRVCAKGTRIGVRHAETESRSQSKPAQHELRRDRLRETRGAGYTPAHDLNGPDDLLGGHARVR